MTTKGKRSLVFALSALLPVLASAQTNLPDKLSPSAPASISLDRQIDRRKEQEFVAFDPHYKEAKAERIAKARVLGKQVIQREIAGQNTRFSHQILSEIIWLLSSTADFRRIDQRLDDLQASLEHPEREAEAEEPDVPNGSPEKGYTEWFFNPKFKSRFLDRISSPEKLTNYFISVSVSDIARTGVDQEREFNEALSYALQTILRDEPRGHSYDPKLKAALLDLVLHHLRNSATGFWGERYLHNGRVEVVDNLSITFHVVSYLAGNVPDMDKVVATALAVKNLDFPTGWLLGGKHWDHLNMDVAELFRLGWPHASDAQRKAIAVELNDLLHWCLAESLQPDGSFKFVEGDNSKEEGIYYGASFLARIGFFEKSKRYWTDQEFPEAEGVRQRIISYIKHHRNSGPAGAGYYDSALRQLGDGH